MAIWRGRATTWERSGLSSRSMGRLKALATAFKMVSGWMSLRWASRSARATSTSWGVNSMPLSWEKATTRFRAPSISRILDWTRRAMSSRISIGTSRAAPSALLRRMAIRVSRSGSWMSAARPLFQRHQGPGRAVGGDDDLLVLPVQGVEGVEKLLLGGFLAGDELDIVDQQDVDRAVFIPEGLGGVTADGVDQVVGELFAGNVKDVASAAMTVIANGMQQVGLAQADAPVQEERVVGAGGILGDRPCSGRRQAVVRADHEVLKGIAGVEAGTAWSGDLNQGILVRGQVGGRFSLALGDDELHFHRAVHHPHQCALCSGDQAVFQPIAGISVRDGHREDPILIGSQVGIAQPGVEGGFGHFHLQLPEGRLPGLFGFHAFPPLMNNVPMITCRKTNPLHLQWGSR